MIFKTKDEVVFEIKDWDQKKYYYLIESKLIFDNTILNINEPIPLFFINSETFSYIIGDKTFKNDNVSLEQLFDLANAADYLNIKRLVKDVLNKISKRVEDKNIKELYQIFNIPEKNQITQDQFDKLKWQHSWLFTQSIKDENDNKNSHN